MKTLHLFQIHQIKTQTDFDVSHQKDTFTLPGFHVPGRPGFWSNVAPSTLYTTFKTTWNFELILFYCNSIMYRDPLFYGRIILSKESLICLA